MRIDAHQHFWKYTPAEFDWIDEGMAAIRRDFLPGQLEKEIAAAGIDGVISVQARQTIEETTWLLDLADRHAFIKGVVGWVDLRSPRAADDLQRLGGHGKLKGVRHVVQGEPDDGFILRDDFNRGVAELTSQGLRYDILIVERQLPQTIRFVDRHPGLVMILDHLAKPRIKTGEWSPWRQNVRELARRENVYCKISGMVTEADARAWTPAQLRPYFDVVLEAFGSRRIMFGSDWPVCLVGCDYARWHGVVSDWVRALSEDERSRVLGLTAVEAYGL